MKLVVVNITQPEWAHNTRGIKVSLGMHRTFVGDKLAVSAVLSLNRRKRICSTKYSHRRSPNQTNISEDLNEQCGHESALIALSHQILLLRIEELNARR